MRTCICCTLEFSLFEPKINLFLWNFLKEKSGTFSKHFLTQELKNTMTKKEIEQEELAKQARSADLQQYTEMAKRI